MRRSRQLKPLSSDHHHALLVAFQLKQALAGHAESMAASVTRAKTARPRRICRTRRHDTHEMRMLSPELME
jgi:hypothetical protein